MPERSLAQTIFWVTCVPGSPDSVSILAAVAALDPNAVMSMLRSHGDHYAADLQNEVQQSMHRVEDDRPWVFDVAQPHVCFCLFVTFCVSLIVGNVASDYVAVGA